MATFSQRKGKFHANIRKKGKVLNASFSDKETADLWVRYHEDLINEIEAFDIPPEKLITLNQALELRKIDLIEKKAERHTLIDIDIVKCEFSNLLDLPIGDITCEMIQDQVKVLLNTLVRRGGNVKREGDRLPSPFTVLRKLASFTSIFNFMIAKGANITNPCSAVIQRLKMSCIKKKLKEE